MGQQTSGSLFSSHPRLLTNLSKSQQRCSVSLRRGCRLITVFTSAIRNHHDSSQVEMHSPMHDDFRDAFFVSLMPTGFGGYQRRLLVRFFLLISFVCFVLQAMEAETTYKASVCEANERHGQLLRVKSQVLQQVRELMLQCDQTMKAVTVSYFQLQHTVSAPAPVQVRHFPCQMFPVGRWPDVVWLCSFRLCAKAADCTSQARSTWNSSGGCPYPASPAETAPQQPLQEAPVAHRRALTPSNPTLKSLQCQRRRESPTGPSVQTSAKVLVCPKLTLSL